MPEPEPPPPDERGGGEEEPPPEEDGALGVGVGAGALRAGVIGSGAGAGVGAGAGEECDTAGVSATAGALVAGLETFGAGVWTGGLAIATLIAGAAGSDAATGTATTGRRGGVRSTIVGAVRLMWPTPNATANTPIRTAISLVIRRSSIRRPMGRMRRRSMGCVLMTTGRGSVVRPRSGSGRHVSEACRGAE